MSYRETAPRPRCARCREWAAGSCLRCERPLCEEHLAASSNLCDRCEEELAGASWPRARAVWLVTLLVGAASIALCSLFLLLAREFPIAWLDRWLSVVLWTGALVAYAGVAELRAHMESWLEERRRERFVLGAPRRRPLHGSAAPGAQRSD